MKLQVVTVSVNYSDFLKYTIEENYKLFDKWIIVTDTKDVETKQLCDRYSDKGVVCIQTDVFYKNGAKFKKYAAINEGLELVDEDAWVLFLDSDIALHEQTRYILEKLNLDETCIYGMDRLNCQGVEAWDAFKKGNGLVINNWLLTDAGFRIGSRLVHYYGFENGDGQFAGWNPIGFFQLAYRGAFTKYPDDSIGADHCDLLFARLWDRSKCVFIPETFCIHLESLYTHKSANWYGRVSDPFEMTVVPRKQSIANNDIGYNTTAPVKKTIFDYIKEYYNKFLEFIKKLLKLK
jgi:hypothetical protein